MNYIPPDNIYWTFSSAVQVIATLVGFLAATFFFAIQNLERQVEKDESLEPINFEIKQEYYEKLKTLFIFNGLAIISSLAAIYVNGFNFGSIGNLLWISAGIIDLWAIFLAIKYAIYIINPSKQAAANKLISKNKYIAKKASKKTVSIGTFMEKFVELEKNLRLIASEGPLIASRDIESRLWVPTSQIIRNIYERGWIDKKMESELVELNNIRNLAAHGQIDNVDSSIFDNLSKQLKRLLKKTKTKIK